MRIRVECYSGHRAEETPRRIHLDGRTVEVAEVIDSWLSPDHRYFKFRGVDGHLYIVRHDVVADVWELTLYKRGGDREDRS